MLSRQTQGSDHQSQVINLNACRCCLPLWTFELPVQVWLYIFFSSHLPPVFVTGISLIVLRIFIIIIYALIVHFFLIDFLNFVSFNSAFGHDCCHIYTITSRSSLISVTCHIVSVCASRMNCLHLFVTCRWRLNQNIWGLGWRKPPRSVVVPRDCFEVVQFILVKSWLCFCVGEC